ncbi:MAG: response regulator [Elusimicrobia bacterium]|nr:response regulator [Elusimicrobiota bacterium]
MIPRVLVVDDEGGLRRLLTRFLESKGASVASVGDGKAALELLQTARFDLVLLDVGLPLVGGLEVLRALRREGPSRSAAVLLMSGLDGVAEDASAAGASAEGALTKPFSLEEMWTRVGGCLGLETSCG